MTIADFVKRVPTTQAKTSPEEKVAEEYPTNSVLEFLPFIRVETRAGRTNTDVRLRNKT